MFGNNLDNGVNNERIYRETKADLMDSTTNRTISTLMSNRNYEEDITMENTTYNEQSANSNALASRNEPMNTAEVIPSLGETFARKSKEPQTVFNKLTISPEYYERLFNEEALEKIYSEELVGKESFRFNPNKTKISDLTHWRIDDGFGIISIRSIPSGFFYKNGSSPIGYKARLGYSKSLKRNICIVKFFNGKYVVPDYLFFRGYLFKENKPFSRNFNLSYVTVANLLSFDSTSEYPDSKACDSIFQLLALSLMGELNNH